MIQTHIRDERTGEKTELTINDLAYWNGPYRYEPFPKQLFRATGPGVDDIETDVALHPDRKNKKGVTLGQDWCESPDEARAYLRRLDDDVAKASAEAQYTVQRMSPNAQAEFRAQEIADADRMTVDVVKPKRGRPAKAKVERPVGV